ncbi:MAG: DUF1080 domain-containing protein [Verrucomicrobiota bacterium]|jgi:hypothetical protein
MKSAAILLGLVCTLSQLAAQSVITPTNHIELFNDKDFSGWTFCMRSNANPVLAWNVTNGVIHCSGKPSGYLRTTQSYSNYALTVEWRFVKVAPKADNTGILVHMQLPDKVWSPCVQVQGKHDNQGDLIFMAGAESKEHRGMDANAPVPKCGPSNEKPVGEWDTVKTVCDSNDVKAYVNGKFMNEGTECTLSSGFIGFQSEGGEFEIRKVFLEPLK